MDKVKSRTIAPAEVREWFKSSRKSSPSDKVCDEIAAHLTLMRWPFDPPDDPDSPWLPKQEADTNQWWDFKGATDAANMLLASIPAMLSHWERLQWAPETRDGYAVIESLHDALSHALPYIEFPFGEYERLTPQKRPKKPKEWHCPALLIGGIVVTATARSANGAPSLHRSSMEVKVVRKALVRMGYRIVANETTISAYLIRWHKKWGCLPISPSQQPACWHPAFWQDNWTARQARTTK